MFARYAAAASIVASDIGKNMNENHEGKFWMVVSSRGPASLRHQSFSLAVEEARRLAAKHPGVIFYVTSSILYVTTAAPPVVVVQI